MRPANFRPEENWDSMSVSERDEDSSWGELPSAQNSTKKCLLSYLDPDIFLDYSESIELKCCDCEPKESKRFREFRSHTHDREEKNEGEIVFIDILPAGISKPHVYQPDYLQEQIKHVERMKKRLQQIVRPLILDKSLPDVMIRDMVFEAGRLRNEVENGCEHVHAVFKELKLQQNCETLQAPSQAPRIKE